MTMYIYVLEYKSTPTEAVLILIHKSVANASCIHRQSGSQIMLLRRWRHLTINEIVSCVGCQCSRVRLMISQLLRIFEYEFQINNIVQQGYEYLLIV